MKSVLDVTRVQITSNGNLPDPETLKDVLVALIKAGDEKIKELGWHEEEPSEEQQSPIILPTGSKREVFKALRRMSCCLFL